VNTYVQNLARLPSLSSRHTDLLRCDIFSQRCYKVANMNNHARPTRQNRILGLILLFAFVLVRVPPISASRQKQEEPADDLYGLYYADWDGPESDPAALVISSDGKPIAPKANDPDAPTQPGFHMGQRHFPFKTSRLSPQEFSFRTVSLDGTEFSFRGRFGREQVDSESRVPYLLGVLTEMRDGRVVRTKKGHFAHALVL